MFRSERRGSSALIFLRNKGAPAHGVYTQYGEIVSRNTLGLQNVAGDYLRACTAGGQRHASAGERGEEKSWDLAD